MKIEDLAQLLNNRLNTFKLSRDYAIMNGDLERANATDVEIGSILDTLYKLNLLISASEEAVAKNISVSDVVLPNSAGIINGYDITTYATDPLHERKILQILSLMGEMKNELDIDKYISMKAIASPVTGAMILSAAKTYAVDARLMMAIMEQDSRFGTLGKAVKTLNPGNVGNDDAGNIRTYASWQEGVNAVADWLNKHRHVEKVTEEITEEIVEEEEEEELTPPPPLEEENNEEEEVVEEEEENNEEEEEEIVEEEELTPPPPLEEEISPQATSTAQIKPKNKLKFIKSQSTLGTTKQ